MVMRHTRGFTLLELSVVLVTIGLLVGGIMAGMSLVRSSEVRAVSAEYSKYTAALHSFEEKYSATPGDMNTAVKYWGAQAGGTADGVDATCAALTTAATGTATCNGDGNGYISSLGGASEPHEFFRAWQHLSNAGMIEDTYSGVRGPAIVYHTLIGTNIPASKITGGGWFWYGIGNYGDVQYFTANYGNLLLFGAQRPNMANDNPILTGEEAWKIDKKLDDALPQSGKVIAYRNSFQPNCVPPSEDAYLTSSQEVGCALLFINEL